jgi:phage shock protein E
MTRARALSLLVVGVLSGLLLTSCGDSATDVDTTIADPASVVSQIEDGATVIDVRTSEEFASGHVADALNIDVSSGSFEDQVEQLDPAAEYVVYCRSGNRSTQAMEKMADLGFEDLTNGGAFANLAAAGAPVG